VATYSASGCDSGDGSGGWGGLDNGGSEAGGSAEGGISSMLERTTACMLDQGVARMVLEDVAEQALAEMNAPPPVSDSAVVGGIVSGDALTKSAAIFTRQSLSQDEWGAYYRRLEQQQQQLAQPQPPSRVAVWWQRTVRRW
jgi:hypothetical protein